MPGLLSSEENGRLVAWSGLCSQQSDFGSVFCGLGVFSAAFAAIKDEEEKP